MIADTARALIECAAMYRQAMSEQALATYDAALAHITPEQIRLGIEAHCRDPERGRWMPLPADILAQVQATEPRHLAADAAWAIALDSYDEGASVVWTAEIEAARNHARLIWSSGDRVGARLAFRSAYEELIRRAGPPTWKVSGGTDPARLAEVVRQAHESGLIGHDQAQRLLPPPEADTVIGPDGADWLAMLRGMLMPIEGRVTRSQANANAGRWTDSMEAEYRYHMGIVGIDKEDLEPYHIPGGTHACAFSGCSGGGTMSTTTVGGGRWYCHRHFKA